MTNPLPVLRRPRVLFVDDQRDVARTLASLLAPLDVECRFADDGERGLQKLRSEVFDLVVVDLRMAPGEWGGLWMLEQLAAHRITVTTLVMSGEGGQSETIKAMRLGAFDFVVKDHAEREFVARAEGALADAARDRWDAAANSLPAAVSLPMTSMLVQTDALHALRSALGCVESILRFGAIAAAAVAGSRGRQILVESLVRPSMGDWRSLCRRLRGEIGGEATATLSAWLRFLSDEGGELIGLRNDLHHGASPTPVWARERLPAVGDWLDGFAALARQLPPLRTVVPGTFVKSRGRFIVDVAEIVGSAAAVRWKRQEVDSPLESGHVHLVVGDGDPVDMWPLLLAEPGSAPGRWTVSVVDSRRSARGRAASDDDSLSYIDLTHGERGVSAQTTISDVRSCDD